jgi:ParB family chromosome partitioning protein
MANKGMGKGLEAILGSPVAIKPLPQGPVAPGESGSLLGSLPVADIDPNPGQPRKRFDPEALQALADSISESGVLQPILVRPLGSRYELVAGERRWRAAQLANLKTVPAVITDRGDSESLEAAVIENMAREDLNPIEEARAISALVDDAGLSREQVARRVGRSRSAISNLLRILDLPPEAIELIESGSLSEGHGRALLLADDHADRRSLARSAASEGWSVRVTEDRARSANDASTKTASRSSAVHPDAIAAAEDIAETLSAALGVEVKVKPRGTAFKAEIALADADEAQAIADHLAGHKAHS